MFYVRPSISARCLLKPSRVEYNNTAISSADSFSVGDQTKASRDNIHSLASTSRGIVAEEDQWVWRVICRTSARRASSRFTAATAASALSFALSEPISRIFAFTFLHTYTTEWEAADGWKGTCAGLCEYKRNTTDGQMSSLARRAAPLKHLSGYVSTIAKPTPGGRVQQVLASRGLSWSANSLTSSAFSDASS